MKKSGHGRPTVADPDKYRVLLEKDCVRVLEELAALNFPDGYGIELIERG